MKFLYLPTCPHSVITQETIEIFRKNLKSHIVKLLISLYVISKIVLSL